VTPEQRALVRDLLDEGWDPADVVHEVLARHHLSQLAGVPDDARELDAS
jgi:hypothetical protein